jgi:hypothetical protein
MDESAPRTPSTEPRFDRRTLMALAGGLAVAAIEAKAGRAIPLPAVRGSWELPAHDLAATRRGGQIAGTKVDWRAELRGGAAGAPAIVDGSVFAASIGGVIASLDLATGRTHWRRRFATPVYGSGAGARRLGFFGGVAVDGERVVAASDRVVALDRRTGPNDLDDQAAANEHERRLLLGTARNRGRSRARRLGLGCRAPDRARPAERLLASGRIPGLEHCHGPARSEWRRRHRSR